MAVRRRQQWAGGGTAGMKGVTAAPVHSPVCGGTNVKPIAFVLTSVIGPSWFRGKYRTIVYLLGVNVKQFKIFQFEISSQVLSAFFRSIG
jgi:hypothetical protein